MAPRPFSLPYNIGIDICSVHRIAQLLVKPPVSSSKFQRPSPINKLLDRICHPLEKRQYRERFGDGNVPISQISKHLAGRWAAKEAVIKAIKPRRIFFRDVVVLSHSKISEDSEESSSDGIYAVVLDAPFDPLLYAKSEQHLDTPTIPRAQSDLGISGPGVGVNTPYPSLDRQVDSGDSTIEPQSEREIEATSESDIAFSQMHFGSGFTTNEEKHIESISTMEGQEEQGNLVGSNADELEGQIVNVSITHDGDYACAVCIAPTMHNTAEATADDLLGLFEEHIPQPSKDNPSSVAPDSEPTAREPSDPAANDEIQVPTNTSSKSGIPEEDHVALFEEYLRFKEFLQQEPIATTLRKSPLISSINDLNNVELGARQRGMLRKRILSQALHGPPSQKDSPKSSKTLANPMVKIRKPTIDFPKAARTNPKNLQPTTVTSPKSAEASPHPHSTTVKKWRPGDWLCGMDGCGWHNHSSDVSCYACGTAKIATAPHLQLRRGDWICGAEGCGAQNMRKIEACKICGAAKPLAEKYRT